MFELAGSRVWVAGHAGVVGSAVTRALTDEGVREVLGFRSKELDLTDRDATLRTARRLQPDIVVLAAARVGGITSEALSGPEVLSENLRIQANVMEAAADCGVDRLLLVSSAIVYPAVAGRPLTPDMIMAAPLDPARRVYAMSKLAGLILLESYRARSARKWVAVLPTNIYGPGDSFDPDRSHVLPSLIRRLHHARRDGSATVKLWGSGTSRRDLLHVDDVARACVAVLKGYDSEEPVNIGSGSDVSIADLARLVAREVGYEGQIHWDTTRPDGAPQRLLEITPLRALGWRPSVSLEEGVRRSIEAFRRSGQA